MFPVPLETAANFALEDYGLVNGFEIEFIVFEDFCNEAGGVTSASEVIADPQIAAVLGPLCSGSTLAALPYLEEAHITMVSSGATRPNLPVYGPTVFNRVILDDSYQENLQTLLESQPFQKFLSEFTPYANLAIGQQQEAWVLYPFTYDAVFVLLNAIQRASFVTEDGYLVIGRTALKEAVRATENFEGVTGVITIGDTGNRQP
jgi:ABC-type branched-subunit amino acid transport system substrate-binding protein